MSLEVIIYLCDNSQKSFTLPNGRTTSAAQYFQLMVRTLKLPEQLAKKCFALWLKSPLLDVQLKPQHIPYRMLQQWPHFLHRFSMSSEFEKRTDEPIMIFRRNAFLRKEEEMQIEELSVLHILQIEAKLNIQQGIYPCDAEDLEQLGELVCAEQNSTANTDQLRENLAGLLPAHVTQKSLRRRSLFRRQESIEDKILRSATMMRKQRQRTTVSPQQNNTVEFMKICWQLPYYGSVIFHGIVARPKNASVLTSWIGQVTNHQTEVYVAINTDGLWVIDAEKKHVLIGLKYHEFNWEMTEGTANNNNQQQQQNDNSKTEQQQVSSLFLEFDSAEGNGSGKLLQIVSKEAPMMSSMIETCINMMGSPQQQQSATEETDAPSSTPSHQAESTTEESGVSEEKVTVTPQRASTLVRPLFMRQTSVTANRTDKLTLTSIPPPNADNNQQQNHHHQHVASSPQSSRRKTSFFRKKGVSAATSSTIAAAANAEHQNN